MYDGGVRPLLGKHLQCLILDASFDITSRSKATSVTAPIFIAAATTQLQNGEYSKAVASVGFYCFLTFISKFLKEWYVQEACNYVLPTSRLVRIPNILVYFVVECSQGLVYLTVKQVAYAEISSYTFEHLLNLVRMRVPFGRCLFHTRSTLHSWHERVFLCFCVSSRVWPGI